METKSNRLVSLDILRGFDMLFIMGGMPLLRHLSAALGHPKSAFANQFLHVPWEGFHFADTIFPLFLFIAGVSFPFSTAKRLAQGASRAALTKHAICRGLILVALGYVTNGLTKLDFAHIRVFSVLQLIGVAWTGAALVYIWTNVKARAGIAAVLLFGSYLLFRFVGAPDAPLGCSPFSPEGNLGCWLDRTLFGPAHIYKPLFDPEGCAAILPSVVMAMLGMFAGDLLKSGLSGLGKTRILLGSALAMLASGLALSCSQPIVKSLWSSSFVLVAGAYSAAMLALFYWIADVKGFRRWGFFFRVIGLNSITIYMAQRFIGFREIANYFLRGAIALSPSVWGTVILDAGYIAVCWLFLYFLYRKQIFLKV